MNIVHWLISRYVGLYITAEEYTWVQCMQGDFCNNTHVPSHVGYIFCMQMNGEDLDGSQYITVKCGTCGEYFPLCGIKEHSNTCKNQRSKCTKGEDNRAQVSTVETTSIHMYFA